MIVLLRHIVRALRASQEDLGALNDCSALLSETRWKAGFTFCIEGEEDRFHRKFRGSAKGDVKATDLLIMLLR